MQLDQIPRHSEEARRVRALVKLCKKASGIRIEFMWKPWDHVPSHRGPEYRVFGPDKDHEALIAELLEILDIYGVEEEKTFGEGSAMKTVRKWNPNKVRTGHKMLTTTGIPVEVIDMSYESLPPHRGQGLAKTFEGEHIRFSTADGEAWDNGNLRRKGSEKVFLVPGTEEKAKIRWSRLFIAEERKQRRASLPPPLKLYLARTETSDTCLVTAKNLTEAHKELEGWAMCEATSMRLIGSALPRRKAGVEYV